MYDIPAPPALYEEGNFCKREIKLAGIIKFPPAESGADLSYAQLPCSEIDRALIQELISTVADKGWITLAIKQNHLRQLGVQILHLHPLKFLSTIFSNPQLRLCMNEVFDDFLKRGEFMAGLNPKMEDAYKKGKLEIYLKDFAAEVKVPPEHLLKYFQSRDWEALVRYLISPS